MTDLLERLRAVNVVPRCDPPSIEDVWRKLDARDNLEDATDREAPRGRRTAANSLIPRRQGSVFARGVRSLPVLAGVAVCLTVLVVAVSVPRSGPVRSGVGNGSRTRAAWHASNGQGPTLSALMAHFAVLRRPPTGADRAAAASFAMGKAEQPTFVRFAGDTDGVPIYFVVYHDFRDPASGPVAGYSLVIAAAGQDMPYVKGNYGIFPDVVSTSFGKQRSAYLSIVPDGVRMVRWRFACPSNSTGCLLHAGQHTVSVPVRDNLAVLPLRNPIPGTSYASADSVTWYHDDGTRTTYTNQNTAVPFAGAPSEHVGGPARPPSYAPGGSLAGETLVYWRSLYDIFRSPQNALDRSVIATAQQTTTSAIVPQLTRVVLDTDHTLVFITLSAVNPHARPANRRYVAQVSSEGLGEVSVSTEFVLGIQEPIPAFAGNGSILQYSIVPDNVTVVQWQTSCDSGCQHRSPATVSLRPHDNLVYSTTKAPTWTPPGRVTWYVRGGRFLRIER
jgi:hypothetical protein